MNDTIIRKKSRGSNRISAIKIKRVRGETILYLKVCEQIAELLKGTTCENSDSLFNAQGSPVKIYNRTERWREIVKYFNEFATKDGFYLNDTKVNSLIDCSSSSPNINIYVLRLKGLEDGVEVKLPEMITIAGLELWADKINKLLSGFYRNYVEKIEIEAILRKPVI